MFKILLILIFSTQIFANKIVDLYVQEGIDAVEAYINKQLISKDYWRDLLQAQDVRYGYYEDIKNLLIANKHKKTLEVYGRTETGFNLVKSYNAIMGKDGDKKVEGDLKTPIGVYTITKRFKPNDLFYGPLAYALSYPNTMDKVYQKNGYGIWIHGSPLDGSQRDPMSKGCIVLDNEKIQLLDTQLHAQNTIIIVGEDSIPQVNIDDLSVILANLYHWKKVWSDNSLESYLSFYDDSFRRFDGKGIDAFKKLKRYVFENDSKKEIKISNINIAPYPNTKGQKIFKIAFYEEYKSKKHSFNGNKELYVKLNGEKFSILVEK
ncbi:MAG: L,D-transpeptidase family protein [Sulfurospirillum sp.]|nr:L,D-transpeptidase family protein [Sulfurospirillum sp.]